MSTTSTRERTMACMLANTRLRGHLRSYLRDVEWKSESAQKIIEFFTAGDMDGQVLNLGAIRAWVVNNFSDGEAAKIVQECREFMSCGTDTQIQKALEEFQNFYRTRHISELVKEYSGDAETLIKSVRELRDANFEPIRVDRLGDLDIDKVIKEDIGSLDPIPTNFEFIKNACTYKGYLRGQLVMVCLAGDTKVMTLDHGEKTLAQMYKDGDKNIGVYSIHPDTLEPKVSIASHVEITGETSELIEVEVEGKSGIKCTPDHLFLTLERGYVKASDLKIGDSLCSIERHVRENSFLQGYECVTTYAGDSLTHILSSEYRFLKGLDARGKIKTLQRHHVDDNHLNNHPDNISNLSRKAHVVTGIKPINLESPEPVYDLIQVDFYNNFAIAVGDHDGIFVHNCAPPGTGKAQPLDSPVFTPHGAMRMGDIQVGQVVSTPDGKTAQVLQVHPQGEIDTYRVTFSDGTSTECSKEHLWLTSTKDERDSGRQSVKSLSKIIKTLTQGQTTPRSNHSIPQSLPVNFETCEALPIHPYVLGVLIGDGCFRQVTPSFTSADEEIVERMTNLLSEYEVTKSKEMCYYISDRGRRDNRLTSTLQTLGLWEHTSLEKFIPTSYLFSSVSDRINLVRGLMDTDGTADKGYTPYYGTSCERLANEFKFLVESLGGIAIIKERKKTRSFRVYIRVEFNPFSLLRKTNEWKPKTKYKPTRYIHSVEYVGKKECQCITLDSESGLYLTNNFVVTHNSLFLLNEALNMLRQDPPLKVYWLALGDMMRMDFITRMCAIHYEEELATIHLNINRYFTPEFREILRNFRFSVLPAGQIDIYSVKSFIDTYIVPDEEIDVFILDYDSNLASAGGRDMYQEGEIVYNTMTAIARPAGKKYRLCLIASQPKIQYWEMSRLPKEAASESARKQAIIDMMITIGKDPLSEAHQGTMLIAKNRRGREGDVMHYLLENGIFKVQEDPIVYHTNRKFTGDGRGTKPGNKNVFKDGGRGSYK
jgi:intein/homing endonuclease